MRGKPSGFPVILLIFSLLLASAQPSRSQDFDLVLERILNPVPDYDPFEKPVAAPQFFPDAVDKRSRELLIDALTNHQQHSLKDHLKFFKEEDIRLYQQRKTRTGLTEHAQDIVNNTIRDRERFLNAQKEALNNASSPARKKYLEAIINHDDLNQADQLMRRNSSNRWAGLFNRMLSSLDLVGVASGNYIGAAAETVISRLYSLANHDMSIEERRALARHLDHIKRFPNDPRNTEIRKQIEKLERTKTNALMKKQIDKAEEAAGKGDLERALFHAVLAAYLNPASKETEKIVQELTKLRQKHNEARKTGLAAAQEKPISNEHEEHVGQLLSALSLRDPARIERAAIDLEEMNPGPRLAAGALDAEAVAMEIRGRHDVAKKLLEQLAHSSSDPDAQKRAAALLESSDYNLLASFNEARSERRAQSMKYVVLGEDVLKKNLLYAAGAVAAAGPAGAVTLGAVNTLMIGNNLINVLTNNPISAQPVIDAGVAYIRSHPQSDSASEVYKILADAYEERGLLDKAINFHALAGTPQEKIASLKEKAAKTLLNAAAKSKSRGTQEYYLTTLIDRYPEGPAAAEATKKLAALAQRDNQGLRMSKQFLIDNPEIYGPMGLGLKASLFDGNPSNIELADRGVNLLNDNELVVYYQTPWGVRSQNYAIAKHSAERFFATLRKKNHQIALADANQRAKGSVGGIKNLPAPILQGRLGKGAEGPQDKDDATFSFVREAAGRAPRHPRVLDYELLSENERDPAAKYQLPPIQGSISASRFSMTGTLPTGLWGNQIAIGGDHRSPYGGVQLPIPLLQGFVPVDFMVQGRPGGFSVYP
ncbi:MAG: tetratricopeptide repeat protein, partial [Candidatus Binatia bacterium]